MEHPPTDTTAFLASVIARRLDSSGISLRAASSATGIPLTTLSRRLKKSPPSPLSVTELASLAALLRVPVSALALEAEKEAAA